MLINGLVVLNKYSISIDVLDLVAFFNPNWWPGLIGVLTFRASDLSWSVRTETFSQICCLATLLGWVLPFREGGCCVWSTLDEGERAPDSFGMTNFHPFFCFPCLLWRYLTSWAAWKNRLWTRESVKLHRGQVFSWNSWSGKALNVVLTNLCSHGTSRRHFCASEQHCICGEIVLAQNSCSNRRIEL